MNDHETIKSEITGKEYYPHNAIRILNMKQATLYIKHSCELLDLYCSTDYNTGEPVLCFIFNKEDSKKYYDLWCKHELT